MNNFTYFYGISTATYLKDIPYLLQRHAPNTKFHFLISAVCFRGTTDFAGIFNQSKESIATYFMADSGGYSQRIGTTYVNDIEPTDLAQIYSQHKFKYQITPDCPFFNENVNKGIHQWTFENSLRSTSIKLEKFYEQYHYLQETYIYDVLHGPLIHMNKFSLHYIYHWHSIVAEVPKKLSTGIALPCFLNNKSQMVYHALLPWSLGYKNCHLLGKGTIHDLPVLIYIAEHAYEILSCDAKTLTIEAIKNLQILLTEDENLPCTHQLSKEKLKKISPKDCHCPICSHFEEEWQTTIHALAKANSDNIHLDGNSRLYQWIPAHNVYLMQEHIDKLKDLVKDRDRYIHFIKEKYKDERKSEILNAIQLVDSLLEDGPSKYKDNIKLVNS